MLETKNKLNLSLLVMSIIQIAGFSQEISITPLKMT